MKGLLDLLPIGIAIAFMGGVTWLLLDREWSLGTWLLAALVAFHGWVHVMFLVPQPQAAAATSGATSWPFDMSGSWLIRGIGLDGGLVRLLGIGLVAITVVLFVMAALATMGWLVPAEWWGALMIGGAASSTAMLIVFFSPALLLGFAINAALVWLVVLSAWTPLGGRVLPGPG